MLKKAYSVCLCLPTLSLVYFSAPLKAEFRVPVSRLMWLRPYCLIWSVYPISLVRFYLGFLLFGFYRAMHFSAKRGIAIACRLSVRPSVRLSVCDVGGL